jgi:ADP-heptose:LPS heptosyltransferase
MKILVRLPNWLGDMVMSVAFLHELHRQYPGAEISVIAKKGIHELLAFFPPIKHAFIFSKEEYKGFKGLLRFGREISDKEDFDLFFCLPDSFSSAVMASATGAQKRIGYKKELRSFLLTDSYHKPKGLHRVDEYLWLLQSYTGKKISVSAVRLNHQFQKSDHIVVNINSEATSRRLTVNKAVEEISSLRKRVKNKIILIGAPKEKAFVDEVFQKLNDRENIENVAGKTTLASLVELLASAQVMLTTDSGPAHLANALGTHTVVLFGAGKESNTAPYNADDRTIMRLNKLSCEPCQKNVCVRYEVPQCLQQLDVDMIVSKVKDRLER